MSVARALASDPGKVLTRFVQKMRSAAPFGSLDWDDAIWDLTGRLTRAGKRLHIGTRDTLLFIEHRSSRSKAAVPFTPPFADFAKAIICARHLRSAQTTATHRVSIRALRYLYAALRREHLCDPCSLEHRHFVTAENAARQREMVSSAYRVGQRLEEIADIVDQHGIAKVRLQYRSSIPRSDVEPIATKMPKAETLSALGDISGSKEIYDDHARLICMRTVDLLVATGFRIGEVLTLPVNPIVNRGDEIGLRYWPEKGGKLRIKTISSVHRELVERAVVDLSDACADARRVARWYERHPARAPLPKSTGDALSARDIERLGLSKVGESWLRWYRVPTKVKDGAAFAMRSDVEKVLLHMYDRRPLLTTGDGQTQTLSQSLIVLFLHELHDSRMTNRFVPTPLSWQTVSDFLGGRTKHGVASVFSKFDLRDDGGSHFRITSHQFRHWLSTIAKRGGLSDVELARWMGRRRIADNRAYDHRTHEERVEEARALIRSGRATGAITDAYRSLPPVDAEAFLAAQVNAVLTTPYGMCVHDYGQGPCERHFSCAGCGELLRRKGDRDEQAALVSMLERTRKALDAAKVEVTDGAFGASNWIARNERLEIDLIAMLAIDDGNAHSDGDLIRVWPQNGRNGIYHDS